MVITNKILLVLFLAAMPEHFVMSAQTIQDGLQASKKQRLSDGPANLAPVGRTWRFPAPMGFMYDKGLGGSEKRH